MPPELTIRKAVLVGQEERDVRRVFEFLAGNSSRAKLELLPQKLAKMKTQLIETAAVEDETAALSLEIQELEEELATAKEERRPVINIRDLDHALKTLGRSCNKKQLEYMIWEVDENLDGELDWEEFKMMYYCNVTDETGLEPFELFNIVQFMTYLPSLRIDKDFKPQITEDDTMSTLFARFGHDPSKGRGHVERMMTKLFGDKLKSQKGEGVLSLDEYLKVVGVRNYERKRSWREHV